ncbi:MAG: hypothetical protein IJ494_09165, partial [Bacteroides sp.]|nr:hypothetical protein [Bacteroides sp.]
HDVSTMRLTRLEEIVMIKPFDCGDADLNGFLCEDAYKDALPCYLKNGFRMLVNDIENEQYTVPMYFDLKSLVVDTDLERTQVEQADDFTIAGRVFDDTF